MALFLVAGCGRLLPAQHQSVDPVDLRPGVYRLDPDHTTVLFKVDHLGFSTYIGRFDTVDATLDFDPERPRDARLDVVIETASVDVNLPAFEAELAGPDWFDSARFPQARFVSTAIEVTGEARGRVVGALTLRGVTRPATLDVTFNGGATNFATGLYTLGFAAEATLSRSAFGIDRLVPAIGDAVTLEIHAEFVRQ